MHQSEFERLKKAGLIKNLVKTADNIIGDYINLDSRDSEYDDTNPGDRDEFDTDYSESSSNSFIEEENCDKYK